MSNGVERIAAPNGKTMLPEGTLVRGYRLSFLACGGMGVVYSATDRHGKKFAIKEVPAQEPVHVLALTQERGLLERIDHPHIVKYVTLFEEDGFYYLVLDFLEGQSLEALLEARGEMSESDVRRFAIQLCRIFEYLHSLQPPVIYRDLKPANVMVKDHQLSLLDFGVARTHKGHRVQDTEAMGSFFTASPEHFGSAETDARSDVFTLGATLYDLLAGGKMRDHLPIQLPPIRDIRPDVTEDLAAILAKAMAGAPDKRFQTVQQMRLALTGETRVMPTVPYPARPKSRLPWAIGAVALVLFAIGLLLAVPGRHSPTPMETDTGFHGDVFSYHKTEDGYVVSLGEDIALFRIRDGLSMTPQERASLVAGRLNRLYHELCPVCGHYKLEPEGFRVARYRTKGVDEIVVFYSHEDDGLFRDPQVLATVDDSIARDLKSTPRYVAGYWRDLTRDLVELSRGRTSTRTDLGHELQAEVLAARKGIDPSVEGLQGIRLLLDQLPAAKAAELRGLLDRPVPGTLRFSPDEFPGLPPDSPKFFPVQ